MNCLSVPDLFSTSQEMERSDTDNELRAVPADQSPLDLRDLRSHGSRQSNASCIVDVETNDCPRLRGDTSHGLQRVAAREKRSANDGQSSPC